MHKRARVCWKRWNSLLRTRPWDSCLSFSLSLGCLWSWQSELCTWYTGIFRLWTPMTGSWAFSFSFLVIILLSSVLFIGKPYNWSRMTRQVTLATGFSLCLSCILGKTMSLFLAYRISKSKTQLMSIHSLYWKIIVLVSVLVEIGICIAYLVLEPPWLYKNMESQNIKISLECDEGSVELLCSMVGIDVLLALLCFLTTFVTRQLPDNYYEGKCITFGMLVLSSSGSLSSPCTWAPKASSK